MSIADLDARGAELWVASTLFGVASVAVADTVGASAVTLWSGDGWPSSANAVRLDGADALWIGAVDGLYRWDGAALTRWSAVDWLPADGVQRIAVAPDDATIWLATSAGLVRIEGVPA